MRTAPALALATLSLLALVGCVRDEDPIIPDPLPSSTPIFASDEEALAAAEEAYGAYLAVVDQILIENGKDPERLKPLVSDELYLDLLKGFDALVEREWHQVGDTSFDSFELQSFDPQPEQGLPLLITYLCVDLSGVDVLDSAGNSVVAEGRQQRTPYQASFELVDSDEQALLVSADEPWTGVDFCAD